jgi:pimeloyl-ACP methyl ester carboxylesterase
MSQFCLVHGSAQDASGWALLVTELLNRGHQAVCPDLPADEPDAPAIRYAEVIAQALRDSAGPPVIVGHSASGLFLPIVATLCRVSRLVFLAAFVPEVGKSPMQQFQESPEMFWPDWIGKDPTKDDAMAMRFLFHDCPPEAVPWALGTRRLTLARGALASTFPLERWPDVPVSYVLCREDRTLRPDFWWEWVQKHLGAIPVELAGGHCPHVSRPGELADVLSSLAYELPGSRLPGLCV